MTDATRVSWPPRSISRGAASGVVAPNPAVGALIVRDGVVIGRGATAPGGRPHAEVLALEEAGPAAAGATLYVTLEPCSHHRPYAALRRRDHRSRRGAGRLGGGRPRSARRRAGT